MKFSLVRKLDLIRSGKPAHHWPAACSFHSCQIYKITKFIGFGLKQHLHYGCECSRSTPPVYCSFTSDKNGSQVTVQ